MIANTADSPIKPGSMGRPIPGVNAAILERTSAGTVRDVTQSGQIMRRLLRARELGLPEGDTSTLEGATP